MRLTEKFFILEGFFIIHGKKIIDFASLKKINRQNGLDHTFMKN